MPIGFADLSVVYPVSRGIAPLATVVAGGLLLGDTISWAGAVGVILVVFGVFVMGRSIRTGPPAQASRTGVFLSLATGCMIAGYHLVDRRAMILPNPPHPWEYMFLMQFFLAVFVSIWAAAGKGPAGLLSEWTGNRKSVVLVGLMTPAAYILIIAALKYGNVTYVAAGRNVGIVISTIVGIFFLKEPLSRYRIGGSALIAMGVAVMVLLP